MAMTLDDLLKRMNEVPVKTQIKVVKTGKDGSESELDLKDIQVTYDSKKVGIRMIVED